MKQFLVSNVKAASMIQVATLKATYGEKYPYPNPFPYKTKKLNFLNELFDFRSLNRLGENSKVICVEGNIGVGKKDFAQRLAKEFDLHYVPPIHDDEIFTRKYGYDERALDDVLSEGAQSYDLKKFLSDPHPEKGRVGMLQNGYFKLKFFAYVEGLRHLLNTGQGIVVVRSPHSDRVFLEAFKNLGWVTKNYAKYYYDIHDNAICETLNPHLTLYLDAPVDVCFERMKKKKDPREAKGHKTLQTFMPALEKSYKQWLKSQRLTHEVLEIDWTEVGDNMDIDVIAEEMESLTLESTSFDDPKFLDWRRIDEDQIATFRFYYAQKYKLEMFFDRYIPYDSPETIRTNEELKERMKVIAEHPAFGYHKDSGFMTKKSKTWSFF